MTGISTGRQVRNQQESAGRLLKARWILPMSRPAIENGGIEIAGERIVAVYTAEQLTARLQDAAAAHALEDLGNAVIVPGFINLHTHVEWTALQLFDTSSALFDWIPGLQKNARSWTVNDFLSSAAAGVHRILSSGTTCVVDSSYTGQAAVALSAAGLRGIVALELFGLDETQADEVWNKWLQRKETLLENARISDRIKISVAPHAPYTVCPGLMRKAIKFAENAGVPFTMHVSESPNEFDWIRQGDARLDRFLEGVHVLPQGKAENVPYRACGKTPVQHLDDEHLLSEAMVAAHAVQLTDEDIDILAARKVAVAHCARSNARLRNGVAPLGKMLDQGVRLGFGTDSAGSTDNLDIREEARFAWNLQRAVAPAFPWDAERALRMLTVEAAELIGMSDSIGSLEVGNQADIGIFNIVAAGDWAEKRPYDALLYGNAVLQELLISGEKVGFDALY